MQVLPRPEPRVEVNQQEVQSVPGARGYADPIAPREEPTETQINIDSTESIEFTKEDVEE